MDEEIPLAAIVGSRETPNKYSKLLTRLSYILLCMGFRMRSGGSGAADLSLEKAAKKITGEKAVEIYVPEIGYKERGRVIEDKYYHVPTEDGWGIARSILKTSKVCEYIDKLPPYIFRLFCRNVYQVLGDVREPLKVDMVIYWALEDIPNGLVQGGTRIAVNLARYYGIPTFNVAFKEDREMLYEYIRFKKRE